MCEDKIKKIPLKFDGFEIGSAHVSCDGRIVLARIDTSNVGQEVIDALLGDSVTHLAIKPRFDR